MLIESIAAVEAPCFAGPKQKGEYVESLFQSKMLELGYCCCRPWGDSARVDFVVFKPGRRALRVQVKSAWVLKARAYHVITYAADVLQGNQWRRYTAWDTDFLVAYVKPYQAWYCVPIEEIEARTLCLSPHIEGSRGRYEKYRDRWDLMDRAGEMPGADSGA